MHLLITILASHKLFTKTSGTKQQAARLLSSNLSKMLFGRQNNMLCAEKEREGLSSKVNTTGDLLVFSGAQFLKFQCLSATHP